jgi:hypothetical protein
MVRTTFCALALVMTLAGCGAGAGSATGAAGPAAPQPARPPALCGAAAGVQVGTVTDPQADELSGLTVGHVQPDLLWSHNDSGDTARIFALRRDGTVLGRPNVTGAAAVDWEDIASGPAPGGGHLIYAGDIGDNTASRASVDVYRFPEPQPDATQTAPAGRLRLHYPDGAHDAEALLVDPLRGTLVIVTKAIGAGRAYSTSAGFAAGAETTLHAGPRIPLTLVTAGDVSGDGRLIALRTYFQMYLWARHGREPLLRTLARAPTCVVRAPLSEGQGEALALTPAGTTAYTTAEGTPAPIWRYAASR